MSNIWITSDSHFNHDRDFIWGARGYGSVYEMNEDLINKWNEVVAPDDEVYHLGDVMLGNNTEGIKLLKQLKGYIHIIRGNHDSAERIQMYNECYNVVETSEGQFLKYNNYHFYLCHYPVLCSNYDDGKRLKNKMLCLCGHTHTKDWAENIDMGYIHHCEVDTNEGYPWAIDDIIINFKQLYNSEAI